MPTPTPTPITDALETVEDVLLAVLRVAADGPQDTPAYWYVADALTVGRLKKPEDHADHIPWLLVGQHQDGGGAPDHRIGSAGWAGLVVVRSLSASDEGARAGYAAAAARMWAPDSPAGYHVWTTFDRPISVPPLDKIHTRAGQWRVSVRRTA